MAERTFRSILEELDAKALNTTEKGQSFERLVKSFLEQDKAQASPLLQSMALVRLARKWRPARHRHRPRR